MIPLARAQKIATRIVDELRPFCARIEIAGSIRRGRPEVGDIDIVLQANDRTALAAIEARVKERCTIAKAGGQYLVAEMPDGVQLDFWFAHAPHRVAEPELFARPVSPTEQPYNFGTLLLSRTGSKAHNIALCERAHKMGLAWNPHWGIYRDGCCVASASEEDIYKALDLPFVAPAERELADRAAQFRFIHGGRVL